MWKFLILLPVLEGLGLSTLTAQSATIPLQAPAQHMLDRLKISTNLATELHPEIRPYTRKDAVRVALTADSSTQGLSPLTQYDLQYLLDDNNEWYAPTDSHQVRKTQKPLFGIFFRTPANLFEVNTPDFHLRVNPMLNLALGPEQDNASLIFLNQRGLEVRGDLDGRVYFYTNILETQARFPNFVNKWIENYQSVPGAGFYKKYNSSVFQVDNGYDFNLANAYIGARITKHIDIQLGHGQHQIGNGYRSLFLSDVGNFTYFLKFNTRVWRLHYQNLFLELSPISTAVPRPPNTLLPKKYIAAHYLNFQATPNLAFGFFEATVFNRSRQFELQYLNPVILYRTVEGMIGSPDNVLIGFDGRWNFLHRFQVYGQVLIDEFLLSALFKPEEKGWWGNKFGWQAGIKYINAFNLDHLDIQLEYNTVRPYTYSSFDSLNSYTHYNQPLAHPLWANFKEFVGIVRYQPHPRWYFSARFLHAQTGENPEFENLGANPLLGNSSRKEDYGNVTGQGIQATINLVGLDARWQLWHNLYVETQLLFRRKDSADNTRDLDTRYLTLGIRWNVWNRNRDF
ncbi:MAG: hypothetical protein H6574_00185 [Lewinellaceae bacterium]|nr:hypothetical protein [Saprospiraceae bacterium]MCB9329473.1 hypothetical protein [Lewinellaceae bacterium]